MPCLRGEDDGLARLACARSPALWVRLTAFHRGALVVPAAGLPGPAFWLAPSFPR